MRLRLAFTLGVALCAGLVAWQLSYAFLSPPVAPATPEPPLRPSRHWGVLIRPFALNVTEAWDYDWRPSVREQLRLAKELGVTTIRMDYEDFVTTHEILAMVKAEGFETVLVLDAVHPSFTDTTINWAELGQLIGNDTSARYGSLVDVWQLSNELTGSSVHHPGDTGDLLPNRYNLNFDSIRYKNVRDYVKAMGLAIRSNVPEAKLMVTGHWVLVDLFPRLIADGVPFDIVGWNWYSDAGIDPAHRVIDEGGFLDLPGFFAAYGKEFWLSEFNHEGGSHGGAEVAQANYFDAVGQAVLGNAKIRGLIVHLLPDMWLEQQRGDATGDLGIVKVREENGKGFFDAPKPAFYSLQSLITRDRMQPTTFQRVTPGGGNS